MKRLTVYYTQLIFKNSQDICPIRGTKYEDYSKIYPDGFIEHETGRCSINSSKLIINYLSNIFDYMQVSTI